ncbi:hypothetical protein ACE2AJ_05900 [Aquihabitans daechungensis]|uniref:hypothetical protein n=1 Tax=Aquihabitans daechungensis TaxID=1052257 RepID=UPI003B9FB53B
MRKLIGLALSIGVLTGAALIVAGQPAGACSCQPYEGRVDTTDAVFVGRFHFGDRGGSAPTSGVRRFEDVQIEVDRVHRGEVHRTQHAVGSMNDACGNIYDAQERVFFAFVPEEEVDGGAQPDGVYGVNGCSSLPVADLPAAVAAELDALGPPTDPLPGSSAAAIESPSRVRPTAGERRWIVAVVLGAAAIGVAGVVLRRHRAARGTAS